ncbi:hypothetical protein RBB79_11915 [Tunturiibacter empetritectus]|uniref:Uncharacterized protein n=1 Tax=Tunturiibacter lichenicola TaxID=2051959 RepID=A0A852VF66_9BACT|nr:hypothetical protein [Edaphobacter lichenicola]NYF90290.1 hypothetical protein [Edaphobacter lichenicola]
MLSRFGAGASRKLGVLARVVCPLLAVSASVAASAQAAAAPAQAAAPVQAAASAQTVAEAPPPPGQVRIRVINALTNAPVHDERLNVALREDQIGSVAMGTDKNGFILVDPKKATILRILANMYADCRPRSELYTNYSVAAILSAGVTAGNLCSSASPKAKPGELILYEVPKTYLRQYPAPPVDSLPHSPN